MALALALTQRLVAAAALVWLVAAAARAGYGNLLLAAGAALAWRALRRGPGPGSTFGTARLCTAADARRGGLTQAGAGLHLGRLVADPPPVAAVVAALFTAPPSESRRVVDDLAVCGRCRSAPGVPLWLGWFPHALVVGPSGSGKGAAVLVPTLLAYDAPVVVLDIKAELVKIAGPARLRRFGRRAVVIDPYRVACPAGGAAFNPLQTGFAPGDPRLPDLARDLASAMVVRAPNENQPWFNDAATGVLHGFILLAMNDPNPAMRNLEAVADAIANPVAFDACLRAMAATPDYGGVLRRLGGQAGQLQDRERASVVGTVHTHLAWLNSQLAGDAVRATTFDPLSLKDPDAKADLYLVVPPERLTSARGLVRFLLTGVFRRLAGGGLGESRPVLVVLDEMAALGHLEVVETAVTLLRGWGVKVVIVLQSLGQLQDCFPGEKARTVLANTAQVYLRPNDLATAREISERVGQATVLSASYQSGGSVSRPAGINRPDANGGQRSASWGVTRAEVGRPLLRPEEVLAAPARAVFAFADGVPPVLAEQVRYYERGFRPARRRAGQMIGLAVRLAAVSAAVMCAANVIERPAAPSRQAVISPRRVAAPAGPAGRPGGASPKYRPAGR